MATCYTVHSYLQSPDAVGISRRAQRARAPPYFAKYFKNSPKLTKIYQKKIRGQPPQVPPFLQILDPPLISVYFTTKTIILYFGFAIYRYRPILHIHDIELKPLCLDIF